MARRKLRNSVSLMTPLGGLFETAFFTATYYAVSWLGFKVIDPLLPPQDTPLTALVALGVLMLYVANNIFSGFFRAISLNPDTQPNEMISAGAGLLAIPFLFGIFRTIPYPQEIRWFLPPAEIAWLDAQQSFWWTSGGATISLGLLTAAPLAIGALQLLRGLIIVIAHFAGANTSEVYLEREGPSLGDLRSQTESLKTERDALRTSLREATAARDKLGFDLQQLRQTNEGLQTQAAQHETKRRSLAEELSDVKAEAKTQKATLLAAHETILALRTAFENSEAERRRASLAVPQEAEASNMKEPATRRAKPNRKSAEAIEGIIENPDTPALPTEVS